MIQNTLPDDAFLDNKCQCSNIRTLPEKTH